jgi:hypothetical protein
MTGQFSMPSIKLLAVPGTLAAVITADPDWSAIPPLCRRIFDGFSAVS